MLVGAATADDPDVHRLHAPQLAGPLGEQQTPAPKHRRLEACFPGGPSIRLPPTLETLRTSRPVEEARPETTGPRSFAPTRLTMNTHTAQWTSSCFCLAAALTIAVAPTGLASIRGPYTPDGNTKLLLHLEDAAESGIAANAVAGAPAFIATANPSAATPRNPMPGILGAPGASGIGFDFGTCANLSSSNSMALFIDANGNSVADVDTSGTAPGEDRVSGSTFTGLSGEFTLEALVNFPSLTGANREIISMDNSSGATSRPFQFRLTSTGQLEFNNIAVSGVNPKTSLPTTGPDAFVPNQWFHVALTYDGAGVLTFYWTKLDNARTQATVLEVHSVSTVDLSGEAVLTIGNENRNTSGEGLLGLVDEVRVSDIARSAIDMVFDPTVEEIPPAIDPQPEDQFLGVGETLTIVSHASGSAPLTYRWQKGSGGSFTDIPGRNLGYTHDPSHVRDRRGLPLRGVQSVWRGHKQRSPRRGRRRLQRAVPNRRR